MDKYGYKCYFQTMEFKKKSMEISMQRYGVPYPMQNAEVKKKAMLTLTKNGNIETSSQQLTIYEILKNKYSNIILNYPVDWFSLDIALFINDLKIDIEYDGWYWHQDKQKDRARDEILKSKGWKVLRIRSGRNIPTEDQLILSIKKLLHTDRNFIQIVLSDWRDSNEQLLNPSNS